MSDIVLRILEEKSSYLEKTLKIPNTLLVGKIEYQEILEEYRKCVRP